MLERDSLLSDSTVPFSPYSANLDDPQKKTFYDTRLAEPIVAKAAHMLFSTDDHFLAFPLHFLLYDFN